MPNPEQAGLGICLSVRAGCTATVALPVQTASAATHLVETCKVANLNMHSFFHVRLDGRAVILPQHCSADD